MANDNNNSETENNFITREELVSKIQQLEIDIAEYRVYVSDTERLSEFHYAVGIFLTDSGNLK